MSDIDFDKHLNVAKPMKRDIESHCITHARDAAVRLAASERALRKTAEERFAPALTRLNALSAVSEAVAAVAGDLPPAGQAVSPSDTGLMGAMRTLSEFSHRTGLSKKDLVDAGKAIADLAAAPVALSPGSPNDAAAIVSALNAAISSREVPAITTDAAVTVAAARLAAVALSARSSADLAAERLSVLELRAGAEQLATQEWKARAARWKAATKKAKEEAQAGAARAAPDAAAATATDNATGAALAISAEVAAANKRAEIAQASADAAAGRLTELQAAAERERARHADALVKLREQHMNTLRATEEGSAEARATVAELMAGLRATAAGVAAGPELADEVKTAADAVAEVGSARDAVAEAEAAVAKARAEADEARAAATGAEAEAAALRKTSSATLSAVKARLGELGAASPDEEEVFRQLDELLEATDAAQREAAGAAGVRAELAALKASAASSGNGAAASTALTSLSATQARLASDLDRLHAAVTAGNARATQLGGRVDALDRQCTAALLAANGAAASETLRAHVAELEAERANVRASERAARARAETSRAHAEEAAQLLAKVASERDEALARADAYSKGSGASDLADQVESLKETVARLMGRIMCPLCQGAAKRDIVLRCGHSFCRKCFAKQMKESRKRDCPTCNVPSGVMDAADLQPFMLQD